MVNRKRRKLQKRKRREKRKRKEKLRRQAHEREMAKLEQDIENFKDSLDTDTD